MGPSDWAAAIRAAAKRRGFSLAVVLTLALGIGANTAVFSLIHSIVLRPLPYPDSRRLYTLFEADSLGEAWQLASYPTFLDWARQSDAFSGLAYIRGVGLLHEARDRSGILLGAAVSEQFFPTLAVPALLGRGLLPDDYLPGTSGVVVLSYGTWHSTFGGDAGVIGRTVILSNSPYTVIGVMPPWCTYPDWGMAETNLWLPITAVPPADIAALQQRDFHADSRILARLESNVPLTSARSQMNAVARRLAAAYPETSARWTSVAIVSLAAFTVGDARAQFFMLAGAVVVVLLICCVNLANLYLAQGTARGQEFAIRAALGAGRGRVLWQLFSETLVVASFGGALGTLLAAWAVHLVRVNPSARLPRVGEVRMDLGVLGFAGGLTVATALVFAAIAARRVTSPHLSESLGERGGTALARGGRGRLPAWLVAAQMGLTVVLLIAAALLTQSLWRLSQVDPGFDPTRLVGVWINPPSPKYDDPQAALGLYARIVETVAGVPGVSSVALINHPPVSPSGLGTRAAIGQAPTGSRDDFSVLFQTVSAGYFSMMGIPIIAGREFDEADVRGPPGPLIVSETLAKRWGGRSPVGDRLGVLKAARTRPDFGQPIVGTVVGVVGDVKKFRLDVETPPVVYLPYTHNPWASMHVLARSAIEPSQLLSAVERAIRRVDPAIPVAGQGLGPRTVTEAIRDSYAPQRFNAVLVAGFAAAALLLAGVGIYGVTSYTVALETREIGIRVALGATPSGVLGSVLGRVARIAGLGLVTGLAAALGLARLITGLLYEVKPTDPMTYLVVGALLFAVAVLAGFFPARRAAGVNPMLALRLSL